ncbi:MAG: hypothetical protein AAF404_22960 [Pseudomonadota bacterium]
MKRSLLTKFLVMLIGVLPLSAYASFSLATTTQAQVSMTLALLALAGLAVALTGGTAQAKISDHDLMQQHIKDSKDYWRISRKGKFTEHELQSAVCSFNEYVAIEGSSTLLQVIGAGARHSSSTAQVMLNRAAQIFPAAYAEFDLRGHKNHSTALARQFFTEVMLSAMRESLVVQHAAVGARTAASEQAALRA